MRTNSSDRCLFDVTYPCDKYNSATLLVADTELMTLCFKTRVYFSCFVVKKLREMGMPVMPKSAFLLYLDTLDPGDHRGAVSTVVQCSRRMYCIAHYSYM